MGKISVLLGIASVLVTCWADKDPTILLRPPHHSSQSSQASPVFSASIDSIPTVSSASTNQQSVYTKNPGFSHASASASASGSSSGDQLTSGGGGGGGRHPWYASGGGLSFDYNSGSGDVSSSGASHTSVTTSAGSGYYADHAPPSQPGAHVPPTSSLDGYSPGTPTGTHGPPYTYYYQHYPSGSIQGGWGGGDEGHGGFLGDLGFPGLGAGGGIAGAKAIKVIVLALAKGILAIKPFLIIGLLMLIAIPVLLLLLPIPIITITGQPALLRSARSSQLTTYFTELSGKVLNAEECLERVICKLPQPPEKYQSKAKFVWDEYASKLVTNARVARGVHAYFEGASQKNKNLKCDQKFKCSNKHL